MNSLRGLKAALDDKSFRLDILLGVFLLPTAFLRFGSEPLVLSVIILCYAFLIAIELLNTALERLCDMVQSDFDLRVRAIKDISSAAVFIAVVLLVVILSIFMLKF